MIARAALAVDMHKAGGSAGPVSLDCFPGAAIDASSIAEAVMSILRACRDVLGYRSACVILLDVQGKHLVARPAYTPEGEHLCRMLVERCLDPGSARKRGQQPSGAWEREVFGELVAIPLDAIGHPLVRTHRHGEAIFAKDVYHLCRVGRSDQGGSAVPHALGMGAVALIPLAASGRTLGVLALADTSERLWAAANSLPLSLLVAQAGLAIETAGLREELRDREQQVSVLLKVTVDAQEEERERICLEIHDGVAQTLAAAFQYLQTLDNLNDLPANARVIAHKAGGLVRNAIREAREVIATLRPAALDTLGLIATLRYEMDQLRTQMGWVVTFEADAVRLDKTTETALYRVIHEAVNNVRKHAQARSLLVRVRQEQERVIAQIEDDGIGFDPHVAERNPRRNAVGLLSMRQRTQWLQGSFRVESKVGHGTTVYLEVPVSPALKN